LWDTYSCSCASPYLHMVIETQHLQYSLTVLTNMQQQGGGAHFHHSFHEAMLQSHNFKINIFCRSLACA